MLDDIPPNRILEVFGYTTPNNREIQAFSDMMWRKSLSHRRDIKRTILTHRIFGFMEDIGYYHILDFQIRERQIRFTEKDILANALLAGFNEFVIDPYKGEHFWSHNR